MGGEKQREGEEEGEGRGEDRGDWRGEGWGEKGRGGKGVEKFVTFADDIRGQWMSLMEFR